MQISVNLKLSRLIFERKKYLPHQYFRKYRRNLNESQKCAQDLSNCLVMFKLQIYWRKQKPNVNIFKNILKICLNLIHKSNISNLEDTFD